MIIRYRMHFALVAICLILLALGSAVDDGSKKFQDFETQCHEPTFVSQQGQGLIQASVTRFDKNTFREVVDRGVAVSEAAFDIESHWIIIVTIILVVCSLGFAYALWALGSMLVLADDEPAWAIDYQPWWLLARSVELCGKQMVPLVVAYYSISNWNADHHKLTMRCNEQDSPWYQFPCEGTKAFARNFPLIASVMTFVVAVRFIIQARTHCCFLKRKALIDFHNHNLTQDPSAVYMTLCFVLAVLHFCFELLNPPYDLDYLTSKCKHVGTFVLPCIVFFVVFRSGCDIEHHLVTLIKFYESDYRVAKDQLETMKMYSETDIRCSAHEILKKIERNDGSAQAMAVVIDDIIKNAEETTGERHEQENSTSRTTLFMGLWPGKLLVFSEAIEDDETKKFRISFTFFFVVFSLWCATVMGLLISEAVQDINDILGGVPAGAELIQNVPFDFMGSGYCRDAKGLPPPFFYQSWDAINKTTVVDTLLTQSSVRSASGLSAFPNGFSSEDGHQWTWFGEKGYKPTNEKKHLCFAYCNATAFCSGMGIGRDFCTIYLFQAVNKEAIPHGWKTSETWGYDDKSLGRESEIIQNSHYVGAVCYKKTLLHGEMEDVISLIVSIINVIIVPCLWVTTCFRIRYDSLKILGFTIWDPSEHFSSSG